MRKISVVGIGAGDPEHITVQAISVLNTVDVVFMVDKGDQKRELTDLRREICERYITRPGYRVVTAAETPRDREAAAYRAAVDDWRSRRADTYQRLIADELGEDQHGAFLAHGPFLDSARAATAGDRASGGDRRRPGSGKTSTRSRKRSMDSVNYSTTGARCQHN